MKVQYGPLYSVDRLKYPGVESDTGKPLPVSQSVENLRCINGYNWSLVHPVDMVNQIYNV